MGLVGVAMESRLLLCNLRLTNFICTLHEQCRQNILLCFESQIILCF